MKKIIDFIQVVINEFLSNFVPERVSYEITGECKKCGKCCNYMYSVDTYTEKEFKIMQFLFPQYKRFYIKGKDEEGNLIFACKLVTPDGLCSDYKHRPRMCRNYPATYVPTTNTARVCAGITPRKEYSTRANSTTAAVIKSI